MGERTVWVCGVMHVQRSAYMQPCMHYVYITSTCIHMRAAYMQQIIFNLNFRGGGGFFDGDGIVLFLSFRSC